ncbi:hypothetical protein CTAYLR_002464 [Chrysophaeum taylorii]|uniref:Uncharacterized protein n=1 Tax=Chrysophaeum taylorii TaxID=2483200 RepID=A0AAD7UNJ6_9STRA|nr:hypothetical protein CTAYLR_002464 [Chrysophaeum taylorii]
MFLLLISTGLGFAPTATKRATQLFSGVAVENAAELLRQDAVYDLVYVERLPPPETSEGGLFLVVPEDPPMHLARVVSVGTGLEGEAGHVTPNDLSPGDLVYLKYPWGIGPRDEQTGGGDDEIRRFSFIRYQDVAAVVKPE